MSNENEESQLQDKQLTQQEPLPQQEGAATIESELDIIDKNDSVGANEEEPVQTLSNTSEPDLPSDKSDSQYDVPDPQSDTTNAPPVDNLAGIESILSNLQQSVENLQNQFDNCILYDQHKDEIIDRQYKELEAFRSGLLEKLKKSIVEDIIFEIDDAVKSKAYFDNAEFNEANFKKLLKLYNNFAANLCDLLEKHEILSFQSESGTRFDPKTQMAQKKRITDNPALHGLIADSLRYGFKQFVENRDGEDQYKIIRREMVEVYFYQQPKKVETAEKTPSVTETAAPETAAAPETPAAETTAPEAAAPETPAALEAPAAETAVPETAAPETATAENASEDPNPLA